MSKAKHTPGPWACHLGDDGASCDCPHVLAEYGGMGSIATIDVCKTMEQPWGDDHGPDVEQAKANARLIAAAPDLLQALMTCPPTSNPDLTAQEHLDRINAWWRIYARPAIAKTKGGAA